MFPCMIDTYEDVVLSTLKLHYETGDSRDHIRIGGIFPKEGHLVNPSMGPLLKETTSMSISKILLRDIWFENFKYKNHY